MLMMGHELLQRVGLQQRGIAGHDQYHIVIFDLVSGLQEGMSGPQLFRLDSKIDILPGKQIFDHFMVRSNHQGNFFNPGLVDCLDNMFNHGNPCDRVDNFGNIGTHPYALAGSQDDR